MTPFLSFVRIFAKGVQSQAFPASCPATSLPIYLPYCPMPRLPRDKSKKLAEQAAAIVCLRSRGLPEGHLGEESPSWHKRKREATDQDPGGPRAQEQAVPGELCKKLFVALGSGEESPREGW